MNTPQKASIPCDQASPQILPVSALPAGRWHYQHLLPGTGLSDGHHRLAGAAGFNCIGDVNGRQGIGYSVENLLSILESLLFGNGDRLPTILIGCGRLGKAVSRFITTDTNGYKADRGL